MEEKSEMEEIKKLVKDPKLVVGTRNTMKKLKSNKLEKIWVSSNAPSELKDDVSRYAQMNGISVVMLSVPNDELGVLCKKQFSVSMVSLLKGEK